MLLPFAAVALVPKRCPNAKMYDLLPLFWFRSGVAMPRYTIYDRCLGLEVVPNVKMEDLLPLLALGSKWCPSVKIYGSFPLL